MGMRAILLSLALATGAAGAPQVSLAQDAEANRVSPTSKWILDYGETRCRIGRFFGEGEDRTLFYIEQRQPSSNFHWLLAGGGIEGIRKGRNIEVQLGPVQEAFEVQTDGTEFPNFGEAISGIGHAPIDPAVGLPVLNPETGKQIDWISVESKKIARTIYETGNLEQPFRALNKCMESLVEHWGLDLDQQRTRAEAPIWKNISKGAAAIQEHYPYKAHSRGKQATIQVRVMVSEQGEVTDCALSEITEADVFLANGRVCRTILREAEFEPARDINGQPIPSYFTTRIRYIMP